MRILRYLVLTLLASLSACGDCTSVGCTEGLIVMLTGTEGGPFRLETQVGSDPAIVVECTSGTCGTMAIVEGVQADTVTMRLTAGGRTTVRTVRPDYRTDYPNGSGCPGRCRTGHVVMGL
jgi:hypothetical protein